MYQHIIILPESPKMKLAVQTDSSSSDDGDDPLVTLTEMQRAIAPSVNTGDDIVVFEIADLHRTAGPVDEEIRSFRDRRVWVFIFVFATFGIIVNAMLYWAGIYTTSPTQ